MTGVAQQVLGGWQINAVATWQTGLPFNITNATARVNTGGGDRPNLVGVAELDDPVYTRWFNTAAFAAQPINTIGDTVVGRNFLHGPNQRRLDLSVFKDFTLPRSARLQVRVEAQKIAPVSFREPNARKQCHLRDDHQHQRCATSTVALKLFFVRRRHTHRGARTVATLADFARIP